MNVLIALSSLALLGAQAQAQSQGQPQAQSQGPPQAQSQAQSQVQFQAVNYSGPVLHEQLVCAPQTQPSEPPAGMRVIGNQERNRHMFAPGDNLIIDAGTAQGIKPGQQFFVRRVVRDMFVWQNTGEPQPVSIHTAGWITIVDIRDNLAAAQVTQACDGIIAGDYLEPFVDPVDPPAAVEGEPDYEHAARIVMGDERRQMGSPGTMMLLDRGSDNDVRAGQTVTIFRDTVSGLGSIYQMGRTVSGPGPIYQVGRGTVVSVRPQTSLLRIDTTRDAVYIGDRVAINRITK